MTYTFANYPWYCYLRPAENGEETCIILSNTVNGPYVCIKRNSVIVRDSENTFMMNTHGWYINGLGNPARELDNPALTCCALSVRQVSTGPVFFADYRHGNRASPAYPRIVSERSVSYVSGNIRNRPPHTLSVCCVFRTTVLRIDLNHERLTLSYNKHDNDRKNVRHVSLRPVTAASHS